MSLERRYNQLLQQAPPRKPNILERDHRYRPAVVLQHARIGGFLIIAPSGAGKSIFMGKHIALSDCQNHIPQIIIDVGGQCIENFLHACLFLSEPEQKELLSRIVYCDMAGEEGFVTSWPLLHSWSPEERLVVTASRLPELLGLLDENFSNATIQGLTRTIPIAVTTGKILTALQLPITEVFSLLRQPEEWTDRIKEADRRNPACTTAAADMFDYMELPSRLRNERIEPFLNRLQLLQHDEISRAMFGSIRAPTIDFEKITRSGQTVLIDLSGDRSKFSRQFKLQFVFNLLLEYLAHRGRGAGPFSVLVDELSFFVKGAAYVNTHAIAEQFRQLIEQNMRNNAVQLTLATQDIKQIPEVMLTACLNLKNFLFGSQSDPETAEYLANRFIQRDPWEVKYWERVWAAEQLSGMTQHFVIDHRPVFLPLEESLYINSRTFMNLPKGTWLFAESKGEGEVATAVKRIITPHLFQPPFASENKALVKRLRSYAIRKDGYPLADILGEIETDTLSHRSLPIVPGAQSDATHAATNGNVHQSEQETTNEQLAPVEQPPVVFLSGRKHHPKREE